MNTTFEKNTKQKNILHITYDMRIGGTEMVIKNIIQHAQSENIEMSVLCIESPLGPFAKELLGEGIKFYELNRQPGFDWSLIKNIRRIIKTNNINVLHCHQYSPWVYGVIAAAFTKTKVIFTEHGRFYPDSSSWKRKLINPLLNLFTDQVTAISKATKQALTEFENLPEKSIEVIYNGIAPLQVDYDKVQEIRKELAIPKDHTILGTIARFDPIKNHTMMLKAFAQVLQQQPNTTLIIVGDGDERTTIETCIESLKITDKVILTGYKPEPENYLALMDIFLLSSLSEGTSMTLLEAMSLSKPCVVTDAGGNPEVIINNVNGFVTPNGDQNAFANAIQEIRDPQIFTNFQDQSFDRYTQQFMPDIMKQGYIKVYDDIY
ncbi:MAG: glycosyltransferase [Alteromonadaceae bacterium]|nr:glycosyltransferase [Alteromonadaceae bacterium]